MGARELGQLCEAARRERGWSLARMAYEIGLVPPDDRVLNESQAKRILEGQRGLDEWMVQRLIDIFDLDPAEGWVAAGLLPPGVDAAALRKLDIFASRTPVPAGTRPRTVTAGYPFDTGREPYGWPERRRGDRRRRLVLVPHALELLEEAA